MRLSLVENCPDGHSKGRASVEASVKLLMSIVAGRLKATDPDFPAIAKALSSQGAFASLDIHVRVNLLEVRLRGLSLNAQKAAAERSPSLTGGYAQLNAMRTEALQIVREARPLAEAKRGSKAWHLLEMRKKDDEIQRLTDHKSLLEATVREYMNCARMFAIASGRGREFDRLQIRLLKQYGPIERSNG